MKARLAGERPSPIGCVVRRCLAKVVDITLFAFVSYVAAYLILPGSLRFDALVPAFGSGLWVLGFIISIDIAFVLIFGRTPGEMLTGIRVLTLEEERLSFSQRQDRTQDAFVDGTLGCISLLSLFWRREPARYDEGCTICFDRLSRQRLLVTALVLAMIVATLTVISVVIGLKGVENNVPVKVIQLMTRIGFDLHKRWVNPLTGKVLVLPVGWVVVDSTYLPREGVLRVDFGSTETDDPWLVRLAIWPGIVLDTAPDEATSLENLDLILGGNLEVEYDQASLDPRSEVTGDPRFNLYYSAQLVFNQDTPDKAGTAIAWFSDREHAWSVGFVHSITGKPEIREQGYRLAFGLIQTTRASQ